MGEQQWIRFTMFRAPKIKLLVRDLHLTCCCCEIACIAVGLESFANSEVATFTNISKVATFTNISKVATLWIFVDVCWAL
jgi:hypothetical protein